MGELCVGSRLSWFPASVFSVKRTVHWPYYVHDVFATD